MILLHSELPCQVGALTSQSLVNSQHLQVLWIVKCNAIQLKAILSMRTAHDSKASTWSTKAKQSSRPDTTMTPGYCVRTSKAAI